VSENHIGDVPVFLGFTSQEWAMIRSALYELPAKYAVPILNKLETQLKAQATKQKEETSS